MGHRRSELKQIVCETEYEEITDFFLKEPAALEEEAERLECVEA